MARPTAFDRQTSFTAFSSQFPAKPQNGASLDAEFNAAKVALDETQSNLALIQDDDGRLARGSVGRAQFDSSITLGFESPSTWQENTSYTADLSTVFYTAKFYIALATHVSTDTFDATKWEEIADLSASAAIDDGSITEAKLASSSVTADKIGPLAVTTPKIASQAVTNAKMADGAVTNSKVADNAISSAKVDSSIWSTGDGRFTLRSTAASGWVIMDDGTIGNAASGASTRADADCEDLFTLLFENVDDTYAPLLTSAGAPTTRAGQTDAATAWAAGCRVSLTHQVGRAIVGAGAASGMTTRVVGRYFGEETHLLTTSEIPAHSHANTLTDPGHGHAGSKGRTQGTPAGAGSLDAMIGGNNTATQDTQTLTIASATTGISINNVNAGGGGAHNNMQPSSFWNIEIKL